MLVCLFACLASERAFSQEPPPPAQDLENAFPKKPPSLLSQAITSRSGSIGATRIAHIVLDGCWCLGCRLGPREAYRFAKGQEIIASSGQPARLAQPVDFLVVADHSDGFGFFPLLMSGDPAIMADPQGKRWYDMIREGKVRLRRSTLSEISARERSQRPSFRCRELSRIRTPGKRS